MVQSPVRDREQVVRGRLPTPRRDRRPALAALAVLLILLGALGSALIAFRSGDRVSVLVAAQDIKPGEQIEASDFRVAKVAGDTDHLVAARALPSFVGSRAVVGVPRDAYVTQAMFSRAKIVPEGAEEVGVVVNTKQRPGSVPRPGDVVRLYYVASDSAPSGAQQQFNVGDPVISAARVIGVNSGGSGGTSNLTVIIKRNLAGAVASLSVGNNIAVTILPPDTEPDVDLVGPSE